MNTKPFTKLKQTCALVVNTRPNGSESKAVNALLEGIRNWLTSGEDKHTLLHSDKLHGSLNLFHVGDAEEANKWTEPDELYALESDKATVVFTGEQLDNIAAKWIGMRRDGLSYSDFIDRNL